MQIDVPRLQALFKQEYNAKAETKISPAAKVAVKVDLQPQTDWGQIIAHYLSKQVGSTTRTTPGNAAPRPAVRDEMDTDE